MNSKKSLLASAIIAALAAPLVNAGTVFISPDGRGDALLYPYYSVNQGNRTFINITNTAQDAKVVKVRFRDGVGSRDIFDFTLFLSPEDYWVGALRRSGDSVLINTPDNSCTAPMIKGNDATFNPLRFDDNYTARSDADRLSEGHVEVLEMATLDSLDLVYAAIVHDADGIPGGDADCTVSTTWQQQMATQAQSGSHLAGETYSIDTGSVSQGSTVAGSIIQDLNPATGGLTGFAATFNPTDGTWFTSNATALKGYNRGVKFFIQQATEWAGLNGLTTDSGLTADGGDVEYVYLPDLSTPGAESAGIEDTSSTQIYQSNGALQSWSWTNAGATATTPPAIDDGGAVALVADAAANMRNSVTGALMKGKMAADYITSEGYASELVLTFPTRYLHVDVVADPSDTTGVAAPFTKNEFNETGEACHVINEFFIDREEKKHSGGISFTTGPSITFNLCYEVNVIAFNQTATDFSGVLQSGAVAKNHTLPAGITDGWIELDFTGYTLPAAGGDGAINGLPLAGFMAIADKKTAVRRGATANLAMEPGQ